MKYGFTSCQQRADAVKTFLVAKGTSAIRMKTKGYGAD
jgi:outer membrane protein OmpA-like peptidoglycan-associated protein